MPILFDAIKSAAKAKIKEKSQEARNAQTIDEALEIQAEGMAEAIKAALETMVQQALVVGGTCTPNGPIAGATIQ